MRINNKDMKRQFICVAGKNNIAVNTLDYLIKNNKGYNLGVICNKTESGENSFQKSLRWFAKKEGVKEYFLEEMYEMDNLIFLSMEFDRLIDPKRFKDARLYNIHFSLLPKYKGMYTSALPILNGETESGVTLHKIDKGIDTGEIIDQKSFSIKGLTCREIYLSCIKYGTEVVIKNIEEILKGIETAYPQSTVDSTYYSKNSINYENIIIDLNQTAEGIARQIRAFNFREYQLAKVNNHNIIDYAFTNIKSDIEPGTILFESSEACMVSAIDYNIILYYDRLQELLKYCRCGNLEKVQCICSVKRHINESDKHGWTPLMVAVYYNQKDIVKFLLMQEGNVFASDNNGKTIFMYAKDVYEKTGDDTLISLLGFVNK